MSVNPYHLIEAKSKWKMYQYNIWNKGIHFMSNNDNSNEDEGVDWFSLFVKVTNIKTPQTQEDEFIEIQSDTGTAFQRWTVRHVTMLQQVCKSHLH